jgi:hypothetical protein
VHVFLARMLHYLELGLSKFAFNIRTLRVSLGLVLKTPFDSSILLSK